MALSKIDGCALRRHARRFVAVAPRRFDTGLVSK
jgi:hypothetical protein